MEGLLREYETTTILRPEIGEDSVERVKGRVAAIIEKLDGKVLRIDNWGKRKLAYEVEKNSKGIYVYFLYLGPPGVVQEIERNCKMWDDVMRFLTIKVDEDVDPTARPADITEEELKAAAEAASRTAPEELPPDYSAYEEAISGGSDSDTSARVKAAAPEAPAEEEAAEEEEAPAEEEAAEEEAPAEEEAAKEEDAPAEEEAAEEEEAAKEEDAPAEEEAAEEKAPAEEEEAPAEEEAEEEAGDDKAKDADEAGGDDDDKKEDD